MTEREVLRTVYRSTTTAGRLWCESRVPDEVIEMSAGKDVTFERLVIYQVTDGWEPWEADRGTE